MSSDTIKYLAGVFFAGIYIGALVALAWHGTISGGDALSAAGVVALPVIGAVVHSNGVQAGAEAAQSGTTATVRRIVS